MKDRWEFASPEAGDAIRVDRGLYRHYGIYIGNNEVVHFTGVSDDGLADAASVRVRRTGIDDFLRGGNLEVRRLTLAQRIKRLPPEKTAALALSRIGEGGYDIEKNNCAHFAESCLFGWRRKNDGGTR